MFKFTFLSNFVRFSAFVYFISLSSLFVTAVCLTLILDVLLKQFNILFMTKHQLIFSNINIYVFVVGTYSKNWELIGQPM